MRLRSKTSLAGRLAIAGIATVLGAMAVSSGIAAPPFTGLSGAWAGAGRITMSDGSSEPIRCKATYTADKAGTKLDQVLRCASDSYKFNVKSKVGADGNALSGQWTETTYNLTGTFTGTVKGAKIEGRVRGSGLMIGVALVTRGNQQQARFLSQGTEMREVRISLTKR
jgi:hypothetical protein